MENISFKYLSFFYNKTIDLYEMLCYNVFVFKKKGCEKMKNVGIIRRLDPLGRIVIPKEIRDKYGIVNDSPLTVTDLGNGKIMVSLFKVKVCKSCAKEIPNDSVFCMYCGKKV